MLYILHLVKTMNEEVKEFIRLMNLYHSSIYKWVYAKEVNYDIDPKWDEDLK